LLHKRFKPFKTLSHSANSINGIKKSLSLKPGLTLTSLNTKCDDGLHNLDSPAYNLSSASTPFYLNQFIQPLFLRAVIKPHSPFFSPPICEEKLSRTQWSLFSDPLPTIESCLMKAFDLRIESNQSSKTPWYFELFPRSIKSSYLPSISPSLESMQSTPTLKSCKNCEFELAFETPVNFDISSLKSLDEDPKLSEFSEFDHFF
jgi:hypothetical protein